MVNYFIQSEIFFVQINIQYQVHIAVYDFKWVMQFNINIWKKFYYIFAKYDKVFIVYHDFFIYGIFDFKVCEYIIYFPDILQLICTGLTDTFISIVLFYFYFNIKVVIDKHCITIFQFIQTES